MTGRLSKRVQKGGKVAEFKGAKIGEDQIKREGRTNGEMSNTCCSCT